MDEGVDTGLILGQEKVPISSKETASTLYKKINKAHEVLIKKLFIELQNNKVEGIIQDDSKASYWEGRKPEDGRLTYDMTIKEVDVLVRATTKPYPGAFILLDKKKIIIWEGFKSKERMVNESYYEILFKDGYYYSTNFEILDIT